MKLIEREKLPFPWEEVVFFTIVEGGRWIHINEFEGPPPIVHSTLQKVGNLYQRWDCINGYTQPLLEDPRR